MSKPTAPAPDLLNQLHTLRSLANDVKSLADSVGAWQIAAIVATMSEEATICIDKFNAREGRADATSNR